MCKLEMRRISKRKESGNEMNMNEEDDQME